LLLTATICCSMLSNTMRLTMAFRDFGLAFFARFHAYSMAGCITVLKIPRCGAFPSLVIGM
jgi:hypothetical protein